MFTEGQLAFFDRVMAKKNKAIWEGYGTFSLSSSQCEKYLKDSLGRPIKNDTLHDPACTVKKVVGEEAYVEAVFFGSGVFSHPVGYGWIPKSEIKASPGWVLILPILLFNWIRNLFKYPMHIFHRRSDMIWHLDDIEDNGDCWVSRHTVRCKKCGISHKEGFSHFKKGTFPLLKGFGSTLEEVREKCEKWDYQYNGHVSPKKNK